MEAGFNLNARCIACLKGSSYEIEFAYGLLDSSERPLGRVPARTGMAAPRPLVHLRTRFEGWRSIGQMDPNGQLIRINWPISPNITVFHSSLWGQDSCHAWGWFCYLVFQGVHLHSMRPFMFRYIILLILTLYTCLQQPIDMLVITLRASLQAV